MPDKRDFSLTTQEMMAFYEQGDYVSALVVTERAAIAFPEQSARTDFWRICLLTRLRRIKDALLVFEQAVDAGMWWSAPTLRNDPDLKPLQGLPGFESLLAICSQRHATAQEESKTVLTVRCTTEVAAPSPLLVTLHGQASTAEADLPYWEKACSQGWVVAAIQSSQLAWPGAFDWSDRDKAQEEVISQMKDLYVRVPIDRSRVIIGGFSQGAALAIRLTLNGSMDVQGFLAVTPGLVDRKLLTEWADTSRDHAVRGYLVAGGRDPRYEFFKQTCEILPDYDIPCQMEDHPDMGHEFPQDFNMSLKKALKYLLS